MSFIAKTKYLKSLLIVAPSKDTRDYLHGINFSYFEGNLIMVATDGARLLAINNGPCEGEFENFNFTVPRELLENALKNYNYDVLQINVEGEVITISTPNGTFSMSKVEGKFPDWRRVIPSGGYEKTASDFNASLIVDFDKVNRLLGGAKDTYCTVQQNGNDCALVAFRDENVIGVIMPLCKTVKDIKKPVWA